MRGMARMRATRGLSFTSGACVPCTGREAPRAAEVGASSSSSGGAWQSGLFDRSSWLESQAGWARTVVTGRARLGGWPVGVIAVESATVMRQQPADPGMPDSCETTVPQAGQVRKKGVRELSGVPGKARARRAA